MLLRPVLWSSVFLRHPDVKNKDAILFHFLAYRGRFETGSSKMSLPPDCPSQSVNWSFFPLWRNWVSVRRERKSWLARKASEKMKESSYVSKLVKSLCWGQHFPNTFFFYLVLFYICGKCYLFIYFGKWQNYFAPLSSSFSLSPSVSPGLEIRLGMLSANHVRQTESRDAALPSIWH